MTASSPRSSSIARRAAARAVMLATEPPETKSPPAVSGERIESGGERVGHDADKIAGTRDKREKAGMLDVADVRPDDALQLIEQSVNRRRPFGQRLAQFGFEFDARRDMRHWLLCDGFEMFDDLVNDAIAEAAHLFACEF